MSEQVRRAARWCRSHSDFAVAAALTATCVCILVRSRPFSSSRALASSACVLASMVIIAGRRRQPIVVALLASVFIAAPDLIQRGSAINNNIGLNAPEVVAVFLVAFALGSECPWRRSCLGLVPLTVAIVATSGGGFNPFLEMATVGPWLGGIVVKSRRETQGQLELRTRELDQERELFAAQSVRYERARIASELHDIVAHCVSLMVVQANAGEQLTDRDPEGAADAFASIGEAAEQARVEIGRLIQLLDATAPVAAPAGLRIVDELVRRVQASGLGVRCRFTGDSDDLSEAVADTAYRVVQEAVTNAMKHAPGASIEIEVHGQLDDVDIEIRNLATDGASSGLHVDGGGHGLVGMRDRVARCGGTLDVGPTEDCGWRVAARLPRHPGRDLNPLRR